MVNKYVHKPDYLFVNQTIQKSSFSVINNSNTVQQWISTLVYLLWHQMLHSINLFYNEIVCNESEFDGKAALFHT